MKAWINRYWMLVVVVGVMLLYVPLSGRSENQNLKVKNLELFSEVLSILQKESGEPAQKISEYAIDGILSTLDPHSSYFNEAEWRRMREDQHGSYYGIGSTIQEQDNGIVIISPVKGGPADRSGIRSGDIIREINGETTEGISSAQAQQKLRGEKNTAVSIKIQRIGVADLIPYTLLRAEIPNNSLYAVFMLNPTTGYILIRDFGETTNEEFRKAILNLKKQGMESLILDLRGNGGGLLNAAVGICRQLLGPNQSIVTIKGRYATDDIEEITTEDSDTLDSFPIVCLINRGSASASEIVSGAIQDHDRGLIVGTTSWGKGLVQSVIPLGRSRGVAITTARYYTPSGRLIQRNYSDNLDDYLNPEQETDRAVQPTGTPYTTDLGRKVYGGGGINPDVFVTPARMSPWIVDLRLRQNAFFRFAVLEKEKQMYRAGQPINEAVLTRFRRWLDETRVPYDGNQWNENAEQIKEFLTLEFTNLFYDAQQGQKFLMQSDPTVLKALELMPEAEVLFKRKKLHDQTKAPAQQT